MTNPEPWSHKDEIAMLHVQWGRIEVHGHFIDGKPLWSVIAGSGDNMRSGLGDTFEEALGKVME